MQAQLAEVVRLTRENGALRSEVDELRGARGARAHGRGRRRRAPRDAGFDVEDTSVGAGRDAGYMDLLIRPRGVDDVRIGVEIKNKERIDPARDTILRGRTRATASRAASSTRRSS